MGWAHFCENWYMRNKSVSPEVKYVESLFAEEDELLSLVRQEIEKMGKGGIQIRPYEGRLLQFLAQSIGARKIVEVGTLIGYSAIWLARILPSGGKLYSFEKNPDYAAVAKEFFKKAKLSDRIDVHIGDAIQELKGIEGNGPFDMIFIDANKAAYMQYLEWAMKNLRKGGIIVGDNTFLFGNVFAEKRPADVPNAQWETMRKFNQTLADSKDFLSILVPTSEGLTIAVKTA